jgi:hypothetical protein
MNNMTISKQTIEALKQLRMTVTSDEEANLEADQCGNAAALLALGTAAAHTKIIKPMSKLRFSGKDMDEFFRDICLKVRTFGDSEAKALVDYAERRFNPQVKFDDDMYGVTTLFSNGVTYYYNGIKGKSKRQWTYYYEDNTGTQYVSDIHIA